MSAVREVYVASGYTSADIVKTYAKINWAFEEGGYRVVEVNADNGTIREYVTQDASGFSDEDLASMKRRADDRIQPPWTELT